MEATLATGAARRCAVLGVGQACQLCPVPVSISVVQSLLAVFCVLHPEHCQALSQSLLVLSALRQTSERSLQPLVHTSCAPSGPGWLSQLKQLQAVPVPVPGQKPGRQDARLEKMRQTSRLGPVPSPHFSPRRCPAARRRWQASLFMFSLARSSRCCVQARPGLDRLTLADRAKHLPLNCSLQCAMSLNSERRTAQGLHRILHQSVESDQSDTEHQEAVQQEGQMRYHNITVTQPEAQHRHTAEESCGLFFGNHWGDTAC